MSKPSFQHIVLQGEDANTFLQGQLTSDISKIGLSYQPSAIANLKGRIEFGIWIKKLDEKQFDIVIHQACMPSFQKHIKKYGAFSKFQLSNPCDIYPCTHTTQDTTETTFSQSKDRHDVWGWMQRSIQNGNYWITEDTQGLFQPQELRLHQRGGVDYDKGCYLGQEVIARIYFKSAPKAFLHRVRGKGATPNPGDKEDKIRFVNAIPLDSSISEFEALVVATPDQLNDSQAARDLQLQILELPEPLQASVARES